jgi:hypothetical protein
LTGALRRFGSLLLAGVLLAAILLQPAAAERVIYSEPALTASLAGDNTFEPGEERVAVLAIANAGTENEVENPLLPSVPYSDPLTARGVSVSLETAGTPFTVKSDRCLLGDIGRARSCRPRSSCRPATGGARRLQPPPQGRLQFRRLDRPVSRRRPVLLRRPDSGDRDPGPGRGDGPAGGSLGGDRKPRPGHTGTITITFKNNGSAEGTLCAADFVAPGLSVRAVDGGNMIERIAPGGVYTVHLKAEVAKDAPAGLTPADFAVLYQDDTGVETVSRTVRIGIPVGTGPRFAIVSLPPVFRPGDTREIDVTFRNTGDAPAYGAKVRVNTMEPFSAAVSSAALGDIGPGEEMTASFTLTMGQDAPVRPYGYTAVLKYYDESGALVLADPLEVAIDTADEDPVTALVTNQVFLVVVAGLIILGLYLFRFRD